jgi:hypothetical protein
MSQENADKLLAMSEVKARLDMKGQDSARRALLQAKIPMKRIGHFWTVQLRDLEEFRKQRAGYRGIGRPPKKKTKEIMHP